MQKKNIYLFVKNRGNLSKIKRIGKDSGNPLSFPPLNVRMDEGNCPFPRILDSFPKLQPNNGILNERELRILGTNQTESLDVFVIW